MSPRTSYRVTLWLARELTLDVDASTPELAKEIAEGILQFGGEHCFSSTGGERAEYEATLVEGQQ